MESDIFLPETNNRLQVEAASWAVEGALRHGTGISYKDRRQWVPFQKLTGCEILGILFVVTTQLARRAHTFAFLKSRLRLSLDQVALERRKRLLTGRIVSK